MADSSIGFASSQSGAKIYQKVLQRNPAETQRTATDIGWVRPEDTRVNLLAALDSPDKQNIYKFKALDTGTFVMTSQSDAALRVQVMDDHNNVIADSKPNMGKASENYAAMGKNQYKLKAGTYYVKVSRGDGVPADKKINFAMQMIMGDGKFKNDYLTREVSPSAQDRVNAPPALPGQITGTVGTASTFLSDFAGANSSNILSDGLRTSLVGQQVNVLG